MQENITAEIVQKPEIIHQVDEKQLEDLVHAYPYSAVFKVLLLKKKFDEQASNRVTLLEKFAAHIPDREVLHRIVNADWKKSTEQVVSKKTVEEKEAAISKKEAEATEVKKEKPAVKTQESQLKEKAEKKQTATAKTTESPAKSKDSSTQQEKPVEKKAETKKPKKDQQITELTEQAEKTEKPKAEKSKPLKEKTVKQTDAKGSRNFSDWLEFVNSGSKQQSKTPEKKETTKKEKQPSSELAPGQKPLPGLDELKKFDFSDKKLEKENQKESVNVKDLAGKSVTINDDLITETYARILTGQKKYEAAIVAYKKLSLKIPEKSRYFADLIKELEKKI